jgi:hypothetical protein
MSFSGDLSRLLSNKYFLYFIVFLAATNVLGYLVLHKLNAVIFFALVSLLAHQFSKNMAVVLLIALIATNFLMSTKKEGLENQTTTTPPSTNNTELSKTDSSINDAATALKAKEPVKATVNGTGVDITPVQDPNNPTLNSGTVEEDEIEGFGQPQKAKAGFHNANRQQIGAPITGQGQGQGQGPRLDYASTMEAAYDNLDKMLGGDGIKQLTNDTQKLMSQQQQLFNTMNQMAPMLESAQNMLQGFDFKSLGNLSGLAQQIGVAPTVKPQQ